MTRILLVGFSLNPKSHSFKVLKNAYNYLKFLGFSPRLVDVRKHKLPFYDGTDEIFDSKHIRQLVEAFNKAEKIIPTSSAKTNRIGATVITFCVILENNALEKAPTDINAACPRLSSPR